MAATGTMSEARKHTYTPSPTLSTHALLSQPTDTSGLESGALTPGTRSEAEAALTANSALQTDAAAPTTPFFPSTGGSDTDPLSAHTHSTHPGGRPPFPTRTSTNYVSAIAARSSTLSPMPSTTQPGTTTISGPLAPRPRMDSLSRNGEEGAEEGKLRFERTRRQSWSTEDMKRVMSERLMATPEPGSMGYESVGAAEV